MKLTAIAKGLDVSPMTIYRRLKKAGINLESLRDANGEITAAGASVIASLFDAPQEATQSATGDATERNSVTQRDITAHQHNEPVAGDEVQVAVLTAKLAAAEDKISMLEAERDRLTAQLDAMTRALEREQEDRQSERLLLTGNSDENSIKHRLFGWFRR